LLDAEIETAEACKWYEKRSPGLGKRFLKEFDRYIGLISKNPSHFAVNFSEKYRFAVLSKFPYSIVYRVDEAEQEIIIISVFHQHRNPWRF